jgi:hypothetical protein
MGLTLLRNLDLLVLAAALPIFVIAGLPLLGYGAVAAAWVAQRTIAHYAEARAIATGDRRAAMGVVAGTMVLRLWLLGLSVLGAGLVEREAGLAGGVFAAFLFTTFFITLLIVKPLEEAAREH